jgi:phage RecT family recombinase
MAEEQTRSNNPIIAAIGDAATDFEKITKEVGAALKFKAEAMYARKLVLGSWQLMKAEPKSVYDAILDAATTGISLNPTLNHATLIPRSAKVSKDGEPDRWITRAYFMPMYRGLIWLATSTGIVQAVEADVVYQADIDKGVWKFSRGIQPVLEHTPDFSTDRTTSAFLGAWTKAILKDLGPGYPQIDFMSAEDIYKARDGSEAYRIKKGDKAGQLEEFAPWVRWFGELAKKTAVKRAQKTWPHSQTQSDRFAAAIAADDRAMGFANKTEGETDGEVLMITHEQTDSLTDLLLKAKLRPEQFCQTFGIDKLNELPAERYGEAEERLQTRITKVDEPPPKAAQPEPQMTEEERQEFIAGMDEAEPDA